MPLATRSFHNRLALVFDFDETLAPSSFNALVESLGFDAKEFARERIRPKVEDGWDELLAQGYTVIEAARERGEPLTLEHLERVGRELEPFEGVPEMFGRVRSAAREIVDGIDVEFHVLTSGWVHIHRAMDIASEFETMRGSQFHFDEEGEALAVKQEVTHPEKGHYVRALSRGMRPLGPGMPEKLYQNVKPEDLHVPFDQMIYVGDGASDIPVFGLLHDHGGIAIGVFKSGGPEDWAARDQMQDGHRVQNLARADYREGSELMRSLLLATESIAKKIALRKLSEGE